ncbi:substrate-binding domain-containing protein [Marisediminicola sp. LYQ85]|uniref:LacI family DNA-binding transcriptional regulator n=1 Tax=Marisediminicola sp. LYQ85 TaxID=3391062 RepID=UPI003983049D
MDATTGNRSRPATIYDVAREAGVSHQTVSRLLKGHRISESYESRVQDALAKLDYRPNIAARSLATRESKRVAALMYEMTQLGPIKILEGASAAARESGYVLDIVSLDPADDRSLAEAIDVVNQQDVAGIVAFAPNDRMRERLDAASFRVPLYRETEDEDEDRAVPAHSNYNMLGAELAMRHLLDLGHERIVHVTGPLDWPAARIRARTYDELLRQGGLTPAPWLEGDWSAESGYRLAQGLLAAGELPTAVFAGNDQMALGILHALAEAGVAVPGRVSVIGMDDSPDAAYYSPSLTSIPMYFREQGRFAFLALLARMNGQPSQWKTDFVRPSLVLRASTAPPH